MPPGKRKRLSNKNAASRLQLWDAHGNVLYDGALNMLTLEEPLVLSLSIAFFDDPAPCFIHRSAVLQRVYTELALALEDRGPVPLSALSPDIARYLSAFPGCARCQITCTEDIE